MNILRYMLVCCEIKLPHGMLVMTRITPSQDMTFITWCSEDDSRASTN